MASHSTIIRFKFVILSGKCLKLIIFPFSVSVSVGRSSKRRRIKLNEVMDIDNDKNYLDGTVHKCNQCDYASSQASHLRSHLKTHSGERLNKCNQCGYSSSQAGHLRTHLKTHSGEKSNKCNQCDYASSHAHHLRKHLKTHSGKSQYIYIYRF